MSNSDCGYCEKLLCGGSISDEKLFFTLAAKLLCDIGETVTPCALGDRILDAKLTQFLVPQEQIDFWNSFSIPETGAQIFNVEVPNNIATEVAPGDLLPGANAAIRGAAFRVDANYPLCRDIGIHIKAQFTNIGPDPTPPQANIFPILVHFTDADYNILGTVSQVPDDSIPVGGIATCEISGLVPASLNLTYILLAIPALSLSIPLFSTATMYSIVDFEMFTVAPTADCPDPNVLKAKICNLPREDRALNVVPRIFCDDNGAYVRHYRYGADGYLMAPITTDINLSPYFAVGNESICGGGAIPVVGNGGVVTIF